MTTDQKRSAEARTYQSLAELTKPDLFHEEGLPVPKRTEFCCDSLTLAFRSLDEAALWASRLDARRALFRSPVGNRFVLSTWVADWGGWNLLITATEYAASLLEPESDPATPAAGDVFAEDLSMSADDLLRLLEDPATAQATGATDGGVQ